MFTAAPAEAAEPIAGRAVVVDGDTLAVEGTKARICLYGMDAPESKQTCDDAAGERYLCGSRAAAHRAGLIGRTGRARCFEEDRDRYGPDRRRMRDGGRQDRPGGDGKPSRRSSQCLNLIGPASGS